MDKLRRSFRRRLKLAHYRRSPRAAYCTATARALREAFVRGVF